MKDVAGKTVLITGAAMGMGKLFAERAVAEKAHQVILWDINATELDKTADELEAKGGRIRTDVVDVGDLDAIVATAEAVLDEVGVVEVLINNAGVVRGNKYFWESDSVTDTRFTVAVNTLAPMYIAREFLPAMIDSDDECRLVNIASAAGLTSNPRMAAYAGSKWAVVGWSDSVRLELEQADVENVKVTTVCPYYVKTGMFDGAKSAPLLPLLEPDHVVKETWSGMRSGKAFVILPKTVLLGEAVKGVMPVELRDFIAGRLLGVYHTMDDFVGRK